MKRIIVASLLLISGMAFAMEENEISPEATTKFMEINKMQKSAEQKADLFLDFIKKGGLGDVAATKLHVLENIGKRFNSQANFLSLGYKALRKRLINSFFDGRIYVEMTATGTLTIPQLIDFYFNDYQTGKWNEYLSRQYQPQNYLQEQV